MNVITVISSMATRNLLESVAPSYEKRTGQHLGLVSVGGVDAAKRVEAGEPFDVVVLASEVIDKLIANRRVMAGTKTDLVRSGVAIAVRQGARRPEIHSEAALRDAVLSARAIGYSTGPSGTALQKLFARWGVAETIRDRLVQASPGVPVGGLVANGEVDLGFQQLSELMHVEGIDVLGPMPPGLEIVTTFSAGVCSSSSQPERARELQQFLASPAADEAKRRQGMEPA